MNIHSALKQKSRLAGEINKLESRILQVNRWTSEQKAGGDALGLLAKLNDKRREIATLKAKIQHANVNIIDKLILLAETKAKLTFLRSLENYTYETAEVIVPPRWEKQPETKSFCALTKGEVLELIDVAQKEVDSIQDEIDSYNAKTQI